MKEFFNDLFIGFKKAKLGRKILYLSCVLIYMIVIALLVVQVNVEAITPGSVSSYVSTKQNISNQMNVYIDTDNEVGKIYTVSVYSYKRISLFQYLIGKLNNDIAYENYDPKTDLSAEEDYQIGKKSKDQSITNALIVAYQEASKKNPDIKIEYEYEGVLVALVYSHSKTDLKPDDIITHFNGVKIESSEQFKNLNSQINDDKTIIKLTVIRDGKVKEINARKVYDESTKNYVLGISVMDKYKINEKNTYPSFKLHTNYSSIGGSGGAMTTLAIYNALLKDDVTKGKTIMGTGTISLDGTIGKIGGVSQKVVTAKLYNADIFFVDLDDYDIAYAKAQEIKANFPIVKVEKFTDILKYLEGEGNG